MKNKTDKGKNYLEFVPIIKEDLDWDTDESGIVTIYVENKGFMKRITQVLLKKPKISQFHLEKYGSFIWKEIDGTRSILEIADIAGSHFGEELQPLYERISSYFNMLEGADFISMR